MLKFNIDSSNHISKLFFGGEISYKMKADVGVYKTGLRAGHPKSQILDFKRVLPGVGYPPQSDWLTPTGRPRTDENVLLILSLHNAPYAPIASEMLQYRTLDKQVNTYYEALEKRIFDTDSCVHAEFTHVDSSTGRLSCQNPNVQNQPKSFDSGVKKHFTSRFPGGKIVEMDFSQIEIVVQAALSKDKQFIEDIKNKVDFHSKRLALKEKLDYNIVIQKTKVEKDPEWVEKRSKIKVFSFAFAYGAGARRIAETTGMTQEEVKTLIQNEDIVYSTLAAFNKDLEDKVISSSRMFGGLRGYYYGPTGRQYWFRAKEAYSWLKQRGQGLDVRSATN
jgi:DNA polymerase-1